MTFVQIFSIKIQFIKKQFYINHASHLKEYILSSPPYILESVIKEKSLDWTDKEDFQTLSPRELLKNFGLYYFQCGILPTRNEHIKVPKANIQTFLYVIEKEKVPSTARLYEPILKNKVRRNCQSSIFMCFKYFYGW